MVNPTPITDSNDILHTVTPSRTRKVSRYDAQLPCSTPRRSRAAPFADAVFESQSIVPLPTQRLSVRLRATTSWKEKDVSKSPDKKIVDPEPIGEMTSHGKPRKTLEDLPLEIQGLIFDYLFGDICSVTSTSTSLQPGVKRISSAMRHPRRKALTDLALVSSSWRQLVQERIYRHSMNSNMNLSESCS